MKRPLLHGQAIGNHIMKRLLKKTRLGFALWSAFGMLLAFAAGQGAVVVSRINSVEQAGETAKQGIASLAKELQDVEANSSETAVKVSDLATRVQNELAESMKQGEADMQVLQRNVAGAVEATAEIVEQLEELLDSGDLDDNTAGAIEDLLFSAEDSADTIRKEALPMIRAGVERLKTTTDVSQQVAQEVAGLVPTVRRFAATSQEATRKAGEVTEHIERSASFAATARWITMAAAAITILVGVGVPLLLVPRINAEVSCTVQTLEAVADGDLSCRLDAQAFGEFDRIANSVNSAVSSMQHAVETIRFGSQRLATSSNGLTNTANSLTEGANRTSELSIEVTSAAEQMSSSMKEISASVDQVSDSNIEISSAAERMLTNIQDVSCSVERAVSVATQASELVGSGSAKITRLGDAAGEIGGVSLVIQDIADMTNLLALNATIEAARAGEAGKGFAVVATEVKELARQTSEATEQIRQRISDIQTASTEAVDLVSQIDDVIRLVQKESNQIADTIADQGTTTQQIASQITEAAAAAGVVASNVSQTAVASQEIARSIAQVDTAAKTTASSAQATRVSGDELSDLSNELDEALSTFRLPRTESKLEAATC